MVPTLATYFLTSDRKKLKPSVPSSLISNWQSKVSSSASNAHAAGLSIAQGKVLGGLDDDDASAESPIFSTGACGSNHKNEVCSEHTTNDTGILILTDIIQFVEICSSDDGDETLFVATKVKPKAIHHKMATATAKSTVAQVKTEAAAVNYTPPRILMESIRSPSGFSFFTGL